MKGIILIAFFILAAEAAPKKPLPAAAPKSGDKEGQESAPQQVFEPADGQFYTISGSSVAPAPGSVGQSVVPFAPVPQVQYQTGSYNVVPYNTVQVAGQTVLPATQVPTGTVFEHAGTTHVGHTATTVHVKKPASLYYSGPAVDGQVRFINGQKARYVNGQWLYVSDNSPVPAGSLPSTLQYVDAFVNPAVTGQAQYINGQAVQYINGQAVYFANGQYYYTNSNTPVSVVYQSPVQYQDTYGKTVVSYTSSGQPVYAAATQQYVPYASYPNYYPTGSVPAGGARAVSTVSGAKSVQQTYATPSYVATRPVSTQWVDNKWYTQTNTQPLVQSAWSPAPVRFYDQPSYVQSTYNAPGTQYFAGKPQAPTAFSGVKTIISPARAIKTAAGPVKAVVDAVDAADKDF